MSQTELRMLKTPSQCRQWAAWAPALGPGLPGPWGSLTYKNKCTKGHVVTSVTRYLVLSVERP